MPDELDDLFDRPRTSRDRVHSIASRIGIASDIADDFIKVINLESGASHYDRAGRVKRGPVTRSGDRAIGATQIMPKTARAVDPSLDPFKEEDNYALGLRYFAQGGSDPTARRLHYFGGPGAAQSYRRTGRVPNIDDRSLTAAQYVQATGGQRQQQPQGDPLSDLFDSPRPTEQSSPPPVNSGTKQSRSIPATPARAPSAPSYSFSGRAFGPPVSAERRAIIEQGIAAAEQPRRRTRPQLTPAVTGSSNLGELRRMDEPEVKRIQRLQAEEAAYATGAPTLDYMGILPDRRQSRIAQIAARRASEERAAEERRRREAPELERLTRQYRQQIREAAAITPNYGPTQWFQEVLLKGEAGLGELVAAGVRGVSNPLLSPLGALLTDKDRANQAADRIRLHTEAMQRAAIEEGADRNVVSRTVQDATAGLISTAPELAAMSLGVPPIATFAAGGGARAYGRGGGTREVAREAAKGAAIGAAFELPVPSRITSVPLRTATKGALVGGTTGGIELAGGASPSEAASAAVTNALFAGAGELRRQPQRPALRPIEETPAQRRAAQIEATEAERVAIRRELAATDLPQQQAFRQRKAEREAAKTEPLGDLLDEPQVQAEGQQRSGISTTSKAPAPPRGALPETTTDAETTMRSEVLRDRGAVPRVNEALSELSEQPARFYHRDFGEVSESPNQKGVWKGRVRVTDEQGNEHVIKRSAMTGAGNQRAVPILLEPDVGAGSVSSASLPASQTGLTRSFRAGTNNAEVQFASETQRDLYDAGARLRRGDKGTRGVEFSPTKDPQIAALAQRLGLTEQEVIRRAYDTHSDVRAQMKGVKDGETRSVKDNVSQPPTVTEPVTEVPTVPEQPETIAAQMKALTEGRREAVLIPAGTRRPPLPEGLTTEPTPQGLLYFNPRQISRYQVRQKVVDGTWYELIGHVEPKPAIGEPTAVVVAKEGGTEVHSSAVSPERAAEQAQRTQQQFPNAEVEVGGPELAQGVVAERLTAAQKSQVDANREARGAGPLNRAVVSKPDQVLVEEATEANRRDPTQPLRLAGEVLERPRALSDTETVQLDLESTRLSNELNRLAKTLDNETDAAVIRQRAGEMEVLERDLDTLDRAYAASGTEKGRGLRAQRIAFNEDYSYAGLVRQAKKAKGRDLTSEERTRYKEQSEQIVKLETDLAAANERLAQKELQKQIDRVKRRERRTQTKQQIDEEWVDLTRQFAEVRQRGAEFFKSEEGGFDLTPIRGVYRRLRGLPTEPVPETVTEAANRYRDMAFEIIDLNARIGDAGGQVRPLPEHEVKILQQRHRELLVQVMKVEKEIRSQGYKVNLLGEVARPNESFPSVIKYDKTIREKIKYFLTGEEGTFDPEALKLIGKMVRNRIRAGVTDALQLVDGIRVIVGGSEREVRDAISGYMQVSQQRQQSSEARELRRIRSELKRLSIEEDIASGERLSTRDRTRQTQLLKQEAEMQRRLDEGDFNIPPRPKPQYSRETLELQKRIDDLKIKFNRELYRATRSRGGIITDELAKAANVPKTLKSIGDISAVFRQGGYYALTHPVEGLIKPSREMLRSFTDLGWRNVEAQIKSDPDFQKLRDAGVEFTGVDKADPRLSRHEEGYLGGEYLDLIAKGKYNIPGKLVKGVKDFSERTFVSFLDAQRLYVGKQILKGMTEAQRADPVEIKAVAKLINIGTGRGSLGRRGNEYMPALNIAMFSPRLVASRVQLLNNMINPVTIARMSPGARRAMVMDNAKFVGATMAILGLMKAAGASVSLDPDDSEFLKIRIGNTVYDQLAGLQQPMRYLINMARALSPISSRTLQSGDYYAGLDAATMSKRFARSKINPALAPLANRIAGEDFEGRKFSWMREARELVTPLPAQDVVEGFQQEGLLGAIKATPTFTGIGVGSYPVTPEKPKTHAEKMARKFVREKMPDEAREDEQIELDRKAAQLRAASRRGEDVSGEVGQMVEGGKITRKRAKRIVQAAGRTRLQEDLNTLPLPDVLDVFDVMSEVEKNSTRGLIIKKLQNSKSPEKRQLIERARRVGLIGGL